MYELKNALATVALDERGLLMRIAQGDLGVRFDEDRLIIDTDMGRFDSAAAPCAVEPAGDALTVRYQAPGYEVSLQYILPDGRGHLQRRIGIQNARPLSIYRIECQHTLHEAPEQVLDYHTFWNCPTVGFVRMGKRGLFTGFEHPFFRVLGDGRRVTTSFEPSLMLKAREGYLSEPNFFGLYAPEGRLIEQQSPPTGMRYNGVSHTRYRNPCGHIPLDAGEVRAFQAYARDYLELRVDRFLLIFYQFFLTLPQQPETDEDEALYLRYIDNFVELGGDLLTFNPLVRNVPPRPSMDGHWDLAPANSRAARILDYARGKGLDIGFYMGSAAGNSAYCTSPMTPFALENKPDWKKRDRAGALSDENCIASDDFAHWFYQVQHNTIDKYGLTLWDWDPGPGNAFFCYSADHGHIPGKGAYKGFRNAMGVVAKLKQDFPRLYIQGFHGTKEYGLWGFRGFDQHEAYWEQCPYDMCSVYPDFSEARLTASGMRFQSAWNQLFRFMPPETNHALSSRMTQYCLMPGELRQLQDHMGFEYAFFSALAAGASMTITMMPEDLDQLPGYREFFQKWIPWARRHFRYARHSQPFGAQVAAGAMDGFARIEGDHGFLFVFNPGPTHVQGSVALGQQIGLHEPGRYALTQLYPLEGARYFDPVGMCGSFLHGEDVHVALPPYGFMVLELSRAVPDAAPTLFNLHGTLEVEGATARVTSASGEDGRCCVAYLSGASGIERVLVNGTPLPFARNGDTIELPVQFGAALPLEIDRWFDGSDPFVPMHHRGGAMHIHTAFQMPSAIRDRLECARPADAEAQQAIIDRMKAALKRDNFGWAQPHRLHLSLAFVDPNHVDALHLTLNGQPVPLVTVDAWHDNIQSKILHYADITGLVRWDGQNELTLDALHVERDSFMGALLSYPRGAETCDVSPGQPLPHPVSRSPLGLARPMRGAHPGECAPVVQHAWIAEGVIHEHHPYTLCASINLPPDALEGVYASAQISIDGFSGPSLRADQQLRYDPGSGLWKRALLPGSRKLLIIDGQHIHVWAVSRDGVVSEPLKVRAEWAL